MWDTIAAVAADRMRERTSATTSINRRQVAFDLGACDLIQSEWKVPHLANANGGDLFIYPGFILFFISADAFALIEASQVEVTFRLSPFIEEEGVPSDSQVIHQTWKKANKDGSPDRRFANNYQIPVVEYGSMIIRSPTGLNEHYMISNAAAVGQFSTRWAEFRQEVSRATTVCVPHNSCHFDEVKQMPSHFSSTLGPLKGTINELVEPIESIQSQIHEEETGYAPNGLELIAGELTMVVLIFTNADLNITDEETDLLNDVRRAICGDEAFALTSHAYLDMCRRFLSIHPNGRLSIDHKPYSVQYLQTYDGQHGTEYAEKAKAVFFQLAKAVVQADRIERLEETITLLNFKEMLDSSDTRDS